MVLGAAAALLLAFTLFNAIQLIALSSSQRARPMYQASSALPALGLCVGKSSSALLIAWVNARGVRLVGVIEPTSTAPFCNKPWRHRPKWSLCTRLHLMLLTSLLCVPCVASALDHDRVTVAVSSSSSGWPELALLDRNPGAG